MFAYGYLFFYIPYSKNISGKSFGEFGKSQHFAKFFANFDYFHTIPYANGLQFTKLFYRQSVLLYDMQYSYVHYGEYIYVHAWNNIILLLYNI